MAAGVIAGLAALAAAVPAGAVAPTDWSSYLNGRAHRSDNLADTAITPANAGVLTRAWQFVGDPATKAGQPGPGYFASPTVADGAIFIGSQTGWFYKLSATTGVVMNKIFIGYQARKTCSALGVVATATVAPDPASHQDTVYVAAPDGYLYALSAANLAVKWKSVIAIPSKTTSDYFDWSSPTLANGRIYVGISSQCDKPLIRGGVAASTRQLGIDSPPSIQCRRALSAGRSGHRSRSTAAAACSPRRETRWPARRPPTTARPSSSSAARP
jgi:hypothetical protein